jgi:hypothetical protein
MSKGYNLGDLRAAIADINREVMLEKGNGEAPNATVLSRLKEKRSTLVTHCSPQLIDMALTKVLNDVCRQRASRNLSNRQSDLFVGYGNVPSSITLERGLKKQIAKVSLSELEKYLINLSKQKTNEDHEDIRRLFDDCKKYADSDNELIEQLLERKQAQSPQHSRLID